MTHEDERRLLHEIQRLEQIYRPIILADPNMAEIYSECSREAEADLQRGDYETAKHWVNIAATELSRAMRKKFLYGGPTG